MRSKGFVGLMLSLWVGVAAAAAPKQVVLDVENMTCAACSITIGKALDKVPGVTGKQVDADAATVTVTFDPAQTSVTAVARAVTEAGFPAKARTDGG
ncbi:MAG: heavy metal transporter [Gammaproteobacteria bacterium RIFCSPHIGHO2_12_FULL_63_22]|nr:MAG: heavy metal transporter [Gammaproteobacteria bacterium RIFCSPHIGHO2_12_FULL_63_22]